MDGLEWLFIVVMILIVLAGFSSRPAQTPSVVVMPAPQPQSGTNAPVVFLIILFTIVLLLEMAQHSS
ncbi:hypothetical protein ANRL4_04205 [Anaerolineae bacterium]|nr:hypothetical protein ANRL4_04205 [Anaerolineae bacterium]